MGFGLNNQLILDVFSTAEMRSCFDDVAMLQGWLDARRRSAPPRLTSAMFPRKPQRRSQRIRRATEYSLSALPRRYWRPDIPLFRSSGNS